MQAAAPIEELDVRTRGLRPEDLVGRTRPLVMRQLVRDWPAVAAARQSDSALAELLAGYDSGHPVDVLVMPPDQGGVVGYDAAMDGFNFEHFRVSVTDGLRRLASYSRRAGLVPGLAIQSARVADCLPAFARRHALSFLDSSVQPRIWIGNRVTTPVHFDESHNIACVVCGRRRFTLFPPEQVGNLYIGPLDFAPTGTAMGLARLAAPDVEAFPRLREAMQHAQAAELEPGDALFIPPLWWHHVASLERLNAMVNYWWKPPSATGVPAQPRLPALLHCILAFKSLPAAERAAWRSLLDHYVFGEEDPAAHMPEARKGVLGPLTPEAAEALRQRIRDGLDAGGS